MNSLPTEKYKQVPNDIERKTLKSEVDRERFNFSKLEKIVQTKKFSWKNLKRKSTREKN